MPGKRYSVEQIVAKLREAEKLQGQGLTQLCKRLQISDQTFYRWRLRYGALKEDEAQRLKALEQECIASTFLDTFCRGWVGLGEVDAHRRDLPDRLVGSDQVVEVSVGPNVLVELDCIGDLLAVEMFVLEVALEPLHDDA